MAMSRQNPGIWGSHLYYAVCLSIGVLVIDQDKHIQCPSR